MLFAQGVGDLVHLGSPAPGPSRDARKIVSIGEDVAGHALRLRQQGLGNTVIIGQGVGEGSGGAAGSLEGSEGHLQRAGLARLIPEKDRFSQRAGEKVRHPTAPGRGSG